MNIHIQEKEIARAHKPLKTPAHDVGFRPYTMETGT